MIYAIWFTLVTILILSILYSQGYFGFKGIRQSIPQLLYINKDETIDFYRNVLGFEVGNDWTDTLLPVKIKLKFIFGNVKMKIFRKTQVVTSDTEEILRIYTLNTAKNPSFMKTEN